MVWNSSVLKFRLPTPAFPLFFAYRVWVDFLRFARIVDHQRMALILHYIPSNLIINITFKLLNGYLRISAI